VTSGHCDDLFLADHILLPVSVDAPALLETTGHWSAAPTPRGWNFTGMVYETSGPNPEPLVQDRP
jgi:hypothetical protein